MNIELPESIEINPATAPRASIIWLHGLGADGNDFAPLVPQLGIVDTLAVRVVLPHAPRRAVTINNGMVMRAWYDITATGFRATEDDTGIRASATLLGGLIAREIERGVPAERILLAGFSQGGAIALHTGLRYPQRLAGIMVLSAYLPLAASLAEERTPANADVPILQAHGQQDPVVPIPWALQSRDQLQTLGYPVDWKTYPMQHAVCPEEVGDIRKWIVRVLSGHRNA
ncbi:MAG: alpha/beta hydrolase-fold protein [Pseudomonadota bacterium]